MTEAQTWAALGILTAAFFGMMTIVSTLFTRVLRTEIGGVINRIDSMGDRLDSRIDSLRSEMSARFEAVDARFDAVNTRIDSLDRDIQGIISRELGRG